MDDGNPSLRQLLAEDLPPAFLMQLHQRLNDVYRMSCEKVLADPDLGEEQASYALGYYRRALAETVLKDLSAQHHLRVESRQSENGGCKCVYAASSRFGLTMCHVQSPGHFPKYSTTREQSSKINEHISQGELFPLPPTPSDESIYGIFVHTEQNGMKDRLGSLCIGFPTPEFDNWIEQPIDVTEIIDLQQRLFQEPEDLQSQIQSPMPSWKTRPGIASSNEDK